MSSASRYEQLTQLVRKWGEDLHEIETTNYHVFDKQIQNEHIKKSYDMLKEYIDIKIKLELAKYELEQKDAMILKPGGTSNAYFVKSP